MSSSKSTPRALSFSTVLLSSLIIVSLCISQASALAIPRAPARAKWLANSRDATTSDTSSRPIAVPGYKNLPFELPPCEDEAACAEALWRAGSRVNAHAEEEAPSDEATRTGNSRGRNRSKDGGANRYTALTEQPNEKRRPFEAPEWSRIF
ncbi:hypothetical protein HDK77DRAFT_478721 [Phyllosticta capitalensis]